MPRPGEMMYCIIGEASLPSPWVMTRRMGLVGRISNVVERDTIMPRQMADALLKGFSGCEVAPSPVVWENRCHG
jgi:hypothetical protein